MDLIFLFLCASWSLPNDSMLIESPISFLMSRWGSLSATNASKDEMRFSSACT